MKPKHFCSAALCCILILLSACNKDDNDNPLRFYNDTYEVPMGGIRYLGLESGNGDYSLEVEDQRLISAQVEHGWSTPGGSAIYVRGILTGKTTLKVTDAATLESCLLKIKVVDNYEAMQLFRRRGSSLLEDDDLKVLIVKENSDLIVPGKIAYVSTEGTEVTSEKQVNVTQKQQDTDESVLVYVLYR